MWREPVSCVTASRQARAWPDKAMHAPLRRVFPHLCSAVHEPGKWHADTSKKDTSITQLCCSLGVLPRKSLSDRFRDMPPESPVLRPSQAGEVAVTDEQGTKMPPLSNGAFPSPARLSLNVCMVPQVSEGLPTCWGGFAHLALRSATVVSDGPG